MPRHATYANLEGLNRYEMPIIATWREACARSGNKVDVTFSKEDLVRHSVQIRKLGLGGEPLDVKNTPDIIYSFRARNDLPAEMLADGHYAIVGRGIGHYAFVRIPRPNRFALPANTSKVAISNEIPRWVQSYLGEDEQCMLASVHVHGLVARHLGLRSAFQLQPHLRMGVKGYGQVELDGLYVGETATGTHVGIAIEAKDRSSADRLNVSQLFGVGQALRQVFPELEIRLLGAKPTVGGGVLMAQFSTPTHPKDLRLIGKWTEYEFVS